MADVAGYRLQADTDRAGSEPGLKHALTGRVLFEILFSPRFQIDHGRNCQRYGGTYAAGARGKTTSNGSETFHHCRHL